MLDFAKWLFATYGGPGLVIAPLLYALRTIWKDNVDLRARNDRMTDRFLAISAVSVGEKPEKPEKTA
jgi:hypothetical protein